MQTLKRPTHEREAGAMQASKIPANLPETHETH